MINKEIKQLRQFLSEAKTCAIISHINPDGDAMGSSLGLYGYLRQHYPQLVLRVILPNQFPAYFSWIEGAKDALIYTENKPETADYLKRCDLIFCVDINHLSRLEELSKSVPKINVRKVLIDHHPQPDTKFDIVFSSIEMCSTSEFVYRIIDAMGDAKKLNKTTAEALYAGIFTDTGAFSYGIHTPQVFRIVADLMELGIDKDAIATRIFDSYSTSRMRLLGYTLKDKMQVFEEHQAAYIALSRTELDDYNFETGDTEGFVNYPLSIKGITFSAFFYENVDKSHIRVSLRSKGKEVSVNEVARQYFNGGGHFNAAGGKYFGTLQDCCTYFEDILQKISANKTQ
ncbi:exopolyphosphatase [Bacteroidia bacterium]|nr:exopolyphosphatase [Bacteroidia bacterium]GHT81362.1 exopolyphosphatase [Bacteroidia bacterium]